MSRGDPARAVLFDWGGTLSVHAASTCWRCGGRRRGCWRPDDPEPVAAALLAAEERLVARGTEHGDRSGTTEELVRSVAARTHLDVEGALAAYHGAWETTVAPRPGRGPRCSTALRDRGLRTGLLSNTHWPRALHERWLADAGLLDLLDARVYTSDLAHLKPHPEAFGALLAALEVDAARGGVRRRPAARRRVGRAAGRHADGPAHRPPGPRPRRGAGRRLPDLAGLVEVVDGWR